MNTEEIELKEIPTTTISYSEAIAAIQSGFIDEEWEKFKQDSSERANNIVIQNNMTISQIAIAEGMYSEWSVYSLTSKCYLISFCFSNITYYIGIML